MRLTIRTAAVIATALIFAACSDDAAALSKPDYIERANTICAEANDEVVPIWEEFWGSLEQAPANAAAQDDMFDRLVVVADDTAAVWDDSLDELRALGEPEGDEERLERLLDDFEAAIGEFQNLARDAADGSDEAREALDGDDPFTEVNARARVYGLTVCGTE